MKEMDENLATQHRQTVKEALKNVRTLTPRPTLVSPGTLFAALKTYQVFWYFTLQSVFYIQYEFGDKVLYFFLLRLQREWTGNKNIFITVVRMWLLF